MNPTPNQIRAAVLLAAAVVESVAAAGSMGAPGGTLYAALMTQGCTIQQFDSLMGNLQRAGLVTKAGDLYHVTDKGRAWAVQVAA